VDGVSVGAVESYTFSNVISDHTLNASFGHIVKGTSGGNGSVAPSGPLCVQPGTNVEFDINADANYHISQVSLNGNPIALPVVPGQLLKQFKYNLNVTSDSEVSAGFEKDESTITATASSNGSITPSGEVRVAFGQDQTFNINANAGYSITDVLVDGASVGAVSSYSFINVMEDHTINATFSCKITSSSGDNGDIEPEGTLDIPYSNSQTYTMTPVFGYHVADVIVDGASVGTPGTYAFNGVNADHTISVTFAINVYTINVTAGSHGSGTPSTVNVNHGGSASFSIKPDPGYAIDEIMINGTYVTSYSDAFSNVTSNGSISVTFKKINPSITTVVQRGGRISPSGMVEVEQNGSQKFTITPDSGNQILDVRVGNSLPEVMEPGSSVGAVSEYTFENVTRDKYIHALFTVISPVITAKAGEHGSISPDGSIGVNPGDSQTFSIAAEPCYRIKNVKVDNAFIGAKDTYTFTNVISDHSIEAFFEKIPDSTITARAGKDGTIDPSGTSVAGCGTDKTFTMLPEPCYKVLDVKVDGVSVGAVGRYTFTNITASHSIEAVFGPISNSEGKKGELNCDGEINSKDVLLILNISAETVVPNSYQQWAADIDGNGVVNARDALLLLIQIITGAAAPSRDVAGTGHQVFGRSYGFIWQGG